MIVGGYSQGTARTRAAQWRIEAGGLFYHVLKYTLAPLLRLIFRPWQRGKENVPQTGAAILASNHLSFSDHFFMPMQLIPRKVTFLAKAEYFTGRGLKGFVSRTFFSGVGQIPIDRTGGKASEGALRTGLRVLREGHLLGIYPEGTRSPDGKLYKGKIGVARMALEARVPVVPVAMIGTYEVQPTGQLMPSFGVRPGVRFGKPLDFSRYYGMSHDRMVVRAVTDEIMYAILELSDQEYVDRYAASVKVELERARREQAKLAKEAEKAAKKATAEPEPTAETPTGSAAEPAADPAGDAEAGGAQHSRPA